MEPSAAAKRNAVLKTCLFIGGPKDGDRQGVVDVPVITVAHIHGGRIGDPAPAVAERHVYHREIIMPGYLTVYRHESVNLEAMTRMLVDGYRVARGAVHGEA